MAGKVNNAKTTYFCSECGYESRRWLGKCPSCGQWNTMTEAPEASPAAPSGFAAQDVASAASPVALPEVDMADFSRFSTKIGELDRVLGGGVVSGALILIGGDPGIGKSTLLLQAAENFARQGFKVLYATGEESPRQVALRAARLNASSPNLLLLSETCVEKILYRAEQLNPDFLIVDSIQTMYTSGNVSAAGNVAQVRESAAAFMRLAKNQGCPVFLVGHVTKSGTLAGPRVLEHMVDTVLYFEGDSQHAYRVLRAVKNRFGSTNEIGIFEMTESGMAEVANPSQMLLSQRADAPGTVAVATLEGTRPLLLELQALVSTTVFGTPRRMSTGVDYNRMVLLLAVLEKRGGLRLYDQDVYMNVVGGFHPAEPAIDLGIVLAAASAARNVRIPVDVAVFGEVGLSGEVRAVGRAETRLTECAKAGFTSVLLPKANVRGLKVPDGLQVHPVDSVNAALELLI